MYYLHQIDLKDNITTQSKLLTLNPRAILNIAYISCISQTLQTEIYSDCCLDIGRRPISFEKKCSLTPRAENQYIWVVFEICTSPATTHLK